ncbi:MAG TPA: sialidase family protein [Chloroflexota bacterium]|nr:sialidase family protein [Chloroflexota bacterium]
MRYVTVSRYDDVYCAFPDVALTASGRLVCTYRECDGHVSRVFSRIVVRTSDDQGQTWSAPRTLVHHDSGAGPEGWMVWNCPRVRRLRDGRLVLICDWVPRGADSRERAAEAEHFLWWSADEGETWDGPQAVEVRDAPGAVSGSQEGGEAGRVVRTPAAGVGAGAARARGIVPDRITETRAGTLLLLAHRRAERTEAPAEYAYRSTDGGATWQGPITVAHDGFHRLCEGSLVELGDGTLACYLRENSGRGWVGMKALSTDDGRTWHGPYPTTLVGCHRPTAGVLDSGRVLITYGLRHGSGGNRDPYAALETQESAAQTVQTLQRSTLMALDHDNHPQPDGGYTGWVQLPQGAIYCVYYLKGHQDKAWIRAAVFDEAEIRR